MEELQDYSGIFGTRLPSEIQFATKLFSATPDLFTIVPKSDLDLLLKFCSNYVQDKTFNRRRYSQVRQNVLAYWKDSQIMFQLNLNQHDFDRIFAGLLKLFQSINANLSDCESIKLFKKELQQQTKISENLLNLILRQFFYIETKIPKVCSLPTLSGRQLISIKWRLDVIVADLSLSKVLQPVIKFELFYSHCGSEIRSLKFDCSIEQFHRFRFMIASAFRELNRLQNKLT